jgi:hypothetical protein
LESVLDNKALYDIKSSGRLLREVFLVIESHEAAQTLSELERLRSLARVDLQELGFPLIVFGSLMLVSAPVVLGSVSTLGRYWLVAAPLGTVLMVWHSWRQGYERGIASSSVASTAVAVAISAAAFAAAAAASTTDSSLAAAVCPVAAVAVAYLLLAWHARRLLLAVVAAALALLAIILWAGGARAEQAAIVLALAGGASLLATGIWYRQTGHRRR